MRTTLNLDDDVLLAVKRLAAADDRSLGNLVSDLLRQSIEARLQTARRGDVPVFVVPPDAPPFSLDDIKRLDPEW